MPLTLAEKQAITDVLIGLDQPGLDTLLTTAGCPSVATFSSIYHRIPTIVFEFTVWLDESPQFILPLLHELLRQFPNHGSVPILTRAQMRLAIAQPAPPHPWEATLIAGIPVVNRTKLRSLLERLTAGASYSVVMVDGPPGTGRTHSWHLIKNVADSVRAIPVKIDLIAPVVENRTIEKVFEQLVRKLRLNAITTPSTAGTTVETIGTRFADEIATAWSTLPGTVNPWVVFDSLDRPVAPEIRSFICALAHLRLDNQLDRSQFFLLGAKQDYGVTDPYRVVQYEELSSFTPGEIDSAAAAINALGAQPLPPAQLSVRTQTMRDCLSNDAQGDVCRHIAMMMVELREEVQAL